MQSGMVSLVVRWLFSILSTRNNELKMLVSSHKYSIEYNNCIYYFLKNKWFCLNNNKPTREATVVHPR